MLHSYRNKSIDLYWKPIDWLLYECNDNLIWVNYFQNDFLHEHPAEQTTYTERAKDVNINVHVINLGRAPTTIYEWFFW